jgi:hypothetical protein
MHGNAIVITIGGPHPGTHPYEFTEFPGFIPDKGGNYVKVSEMTLFPEEQVNQVTRSATYQWKPQKG